MGTGETFLRNRLQPASVKDAEAILDHMKKIGHVARSYSTADVRVGNVTGAQLMLLRALAEANDVSVKELSLRMGFAHSTVSAMLGRLEKRKLVARYVDTSDRRITRVSLTKEAIRRLQERAWGRPRVALVAALSRATAGERRLALRGLEVLEQILKANLSQEDWPPDYWESRQLGRRNWPRPWWHRRRGVGTGSIGP